jgi:hypothetical protein
VFPCLFTILFNFFLEGSSSTAPQSSVPKKVALSGKPSFSKATPAKLTGSVPAGHKSVDLPARPLAKNKAPKVASDTGKPTKSFVPSDATRSAVGKKRSRSLSRSETPPPAKKRATSTAYRDEIWQILGRNRSAYVGMDVISDDEDMEADATILEREEKQRFVFRSILDMSATNVVLYLAPESRGKRMSSRWRKKSVMRKTSAGGRRIKRERHGVQDRRLYI